MLKKLKKSIAAAFIGVSLFALPAFAAQMPDEALETLAKETAEARENMVGYPVNQNIVLRDFYEWYLSRNLDKFMLNNFGDPFDQRSNYPSSRQIERKVIEFFAPHYGIDVENVWGLVSMSGTDGNNHGIYFGYNYLKSLSKETPILYVSEESHYSNKRLAHLQNIETRLIPCDEYGAMLPEEFERALDPARPALVVFSMGTTFKGGIDDQSEINKIIEAKKPVVVYRHVDAALFGGYLPYTNASALVDMKEYGYNSIAVSGHKFFGIDEPCGVFLTTKEVLARQNAFDTKYLNGAMPMINCSRSALAPLKMYWIINTVGEEGFRAGASDILLNALYLKEKLDKEGYPAWLGEHSNTVFFKRPAPSVMAKYGLAPEYDERFGGELAHTVIMQHVTREKIDELARDIVYLR